jgi:hypothetical protein
MACSARANSTTPVLSETLISARAMAVIRDLQQRPGRARA